MTARYWSSFIKPEILVIINHKKSNPVTNRLIKSTLENNGTVIIKEGTLDIPKKNSFTYGEKDSNVIYTRNKNTVQIEYGDKKIRYKDFAIMPHEAQIVAAIFAGSKKAGLDFSDVVAGISKFDFRNILLQKISKSL